MPKSDIDNVHFEKPFIHCVRSPCWQGGFHMQIERLSTSQFKVFISTQELEERDISSQELNGDQTDWHENFYDLLEEACDTVGVQTNHNVSVELFSLQPHGIFLIITLLEEEVSQALVDYSHNRNGVFQFQNFEDVVDLSKRIIISNFIYSSLYTMNQKYWLVIQSDEANLSSLYPLLSEYGEPSTTTQFVLEDYGKRIIDKCAFQELRTWFH